MTFLEKLDLLMEASGINKHKLSIMSGVPYTTIDAFYKKGYENAKISTIRKIAKALGCSLDYLIEDVSQADDVGITVVTPKAMKIAKQYDDLDDYGKETMEYVLSRETDRVKEIRRLSEHLGTEASSDFPSAFILFPRSEQPASAGTGMFLGPEDFETIYVRDNPLIRRASFGVPVSGDSMEPEYHDGDTLLVEAASDIRVGEVGAFTLDGQGYVKERGKDTLISLNPEYAPIPMDESVRCNGRVIGILDPDWIVEK